MHGRTESVDEQLSSRSDNFADLSWLDSIVHQHLENKKLIGAVPNNELVSIFFLSNRGLVDALSPAPERCLALLKAELPPFFQQYASIILDKLTSSNRDMSSVCSTVAEYVEQLLAVKEVRACESRITSTVNVSRRGNLKKITLLTCFLLLLLFALLVAAGGYLRKHGKRGS